VLVAGVAIERLYELRLSQQNAKLALASGGQEYGASHYRVMQVLHGLFLVAAVVEVWWLDRPFHPLLAAAMLGLLVFTMALRYWSVATLKARWNTRVIVVPGWQPASTGPYRYLRHPNYLAVACEILAIPLIHSAYLTALVFTLANAALLIVRLRVEEQALSAWSGYQAAMGAKPRFLALGLQRSRR
jgi:methyltransferase